MITIKLTGIIIRKIEILKELEKEIKYFESERLNGDIEDILDRNRLDPLYNLYYELKLELKYADYYTDSKYIIKID